MSLFWPYNVLQVHINKYPFSIVFTDSSKKTCTGTIIHDNVVITAAHCLLVHFVSSIASDSLLSYLYCVRFSVASVLIIYTKIRKLCMNYLALCGLFTNLVNRKQNLFYKFSPTEVCSYFKH